MALEEQRQAKAPELNWEAVEPVKVSRSEVEAGYASLMLEGTPTGDTYFKVLNEKGELGYSPTTEAVNDTLYREDREKMMELVPDLLLDDTLDQRYKDLVLSRALDESLENDTSLQYGVDMLEEPEYKGNEYEGLKSALYSRLPIINQYRQAQDAVMDQSDLTKDQNAVSDIADFVTLMIPFYEQAGVAQAQAAITNNDAGSIVKSFILMGESKQGLRDALEKMPVEQRIDALSKFANIVDNANNNLFMTNRMSGKAMLENVVYGGNYEDWERWLDNIVSILDVSIIGKPLAWAASGLKNFKSGVKASGVKSGVRNSSAHRMVQETNPTAAREQVADIVSDTTGETAQALTGASREEAVADSVMPEVRVSGQGLRSKASTPMGDIEKAEISNPELREVVERSRLNAKTTKEIELAATKKVHQLQAVKGVTPRIEMYQVEGGWKAGEEQVGFAAEVNEAGARIRGVYGPEDGGWSNAEEAVKLTEIALRTEGKGVEDLIVLERQADGYKPVEGIPKEEGDYLVALDYNYELKFSDVMGNHEQFGTARNWLNRVPVWAKLKLNRIVMDPHSVFDPFITLGANIAVDLAARAKKTLWRDAESFSTSLQGLSKETQSVVLDYIKEANEKGLGFNEATLRNDWGLDDKAISTIKSFREFWDNEWAVHNLYEARSMANDGYVVLEDAATDTRIFGKPQRKQDVDTGRWVLDATTEDVYKITDSALEDLYNSGGGIVKMRKAVDFDGKMAEYVIHHSSDKVRAVYQSDIIYPYRKGYYKVSYTHPHYIIQTVKEGDRTYTQAIATAETVEDAKLYIDRLRKEDPQGDFTYRGDVTDPAERAGFDRDVYETNGRSSQRFRGERLEDATAIVHNTEQTNVKGPVDAMIDASRSLGEKIGMSDWLQSTKQRFIDQYEDLLTRDEKGILHFPKRIEDIGNNAKADTAEVADARALFEYIAFIEHGEVNSLDELSKGILRSAAETAGEKGFGTVEKALRFASKIGPSEAAKTAAFHLYIALNPLRQAMLNAHQSTLLLANFPRYMTNPRGITADITAFADLAASGGKNLKALAKASNRSESELRMMYKEFQRSGLEDSVDVQNMVRGSLAEFVEGRKVAGNKATRTAAKMGGVIRKVGFDSGEWWNLASAWLAHYDDATQGGKALTKTELMQVGGKTRNYTMNMNRAGDMPYNQNSLAMIFQFMQVPHKSLLQMTNRALTKEQRVRLGLYNGLAYSLPASAMYAYFGDLLPDRETNPELHDAVVQGLEFYILNKSVQGITGLDSDIDFSSLAPAEASGIFELIHGLLTTDVGKVVANTPAGQLFLGDNPRITNMFKTAARFFNVTDDFEDDPTTLAHVIKDFAMMSSGYSNFMKAKMAWEFNKLVSAHGVIQDPDVSSPEAIALLFGFRTMDAVRDQVLRSSIYKTKAEAIDDADKFYKEFTGRLGKEGITAEEIDYHVKVMSQAMRVLGDNSTAVKRINSNLSRDANRGQGAIYNAVIQLAGVGELADLETMAKNAPDYDPAKKQMLLDAIKNIREWKNE